MKEIALATGGGDLVRPDAPKDLADAIIRRLKNPEEGADIGRRGRERAIDLYAWPRIASLTHSYHLDAITAHQCRMARVDSKRKKFMVGTAGSFANRGRLRR